MSGRTKREAVEVHRVEGGSDECWLWTLKPDPSGYGQVDVWDEGRREHWPAHRLAYFLSTGERPEQVHHSCGTKLCVNPAHLVGMTLVEHQKAHHFLNGCEKGHSWDDPANVRFMAPGKRQCRPCNIERCRLRRERIRGAKAVASE